MKKILLKIWPIFIIVFLWIVFCFPYFGKGLIPFPSKYLVTFFPPWNASYGMPVKNNAMPDVITQIYPWKTLTIESWKNGQIPLWNPYSFAGTAHAGNYQSAVFTPFNIIFFLFSFIDAWSIFILLQPILAGFGAYLFLRSLNRSKPASLLGGVGYMFCGFMVTWMAYGTLGYAALFLPWALWAITVYCRKNSVGYLIALSFFIATSFLAGHFQISLYVLAAVISYIVFISISSRSIGAGIRLLLFTFFGVLLAAPQIFLTLAAYTGSTRSTSFIQGEVIPWKYIITLFSPDFYGNPVTRNDWFGHYAEWASYVGIIPLLLALFAISRKWKGYIRFFAVLAIFSVFLAYPTPLNNLLYALKIPAISTSAASRIIILFSFSLAVLSSFGMDELIEVWSGKKKRSLIIFTVSATVMVFIVWGIVLFVRPFSAEHLTIAKRNLFLPTILTISAFFCMLMGFFKKHKLQSIAVCLLIGISMFDMYRYANKWMPFEERKFIYPEVGVLSFLQKNVGTDRVFGNIGGEVGMPYRLPLIEGYDAMYQGRFAEFMNAASSGVVSPGGRSVVLFDKYGRYKNDVLQLLGVRYIVHRVSDGRNSWAFPVWEYGSGEMAQVYKDEQYEVYEYIKVYPRAFFVSSYEVIQDKQKIVDRLFDIKFNKRESVILEENPVIEPAIGDGSVDMVIYSSNRIVLKTDSKANKLLFLGDVYDAGWEAFIDGKRTEVYRADYDFRAIAVPAGSHTVEYRYKPQGFSIGIVCSALSIVSGGIICLWLQKKKSN